MSLICIFLCQVKKHDHSERMKKSERTTKVNQDDNDETDETKIKKLRKNFNFMNSLHKQYKDKQSGPRSEASRCGTNQNPLIYAGILYQKGLENRSKYKHGTTGG